MLPVIHTQTMEAATTLSLIPQMIAAWVAGSVGTVGLLLSAFGLYGLTAFLVAQRTREIAIRIALGSTREAVLRLILRESGRLALIGAAVGIALAIGASLLLSSFLVGLGPVDPVAFAVALVLLSGAMLLASMTGTAGGAHGPMRALRAE